MDTTLSVESPPQPQQAYKQICAASAHWQGYDTFLFQLNSMKKQRMKQRKSEHTWKYGILPVEVRDDSKTGQLGWPLLLNGRRLQSSSGASPTSLGLKTLSCLSTSSHGRIVAVVFSQTQ
jgi:hypothetical protein